MREPLVLSTADDLRAIVADAVADGVRAALSELAELRAEVARLRVALADRAEPEVKLYGTLSETAKLWGVSVRQLRRDIAAGKVEVIRLPGGTKKRPRRRIELDPQHREQLELIRTRRAEARSAIKHEAALRALTEFLVVVCSAKATRVASDSTGDDTRAPEAAE